MKNPMFKLMKDAKSQYMFLHVWVKDRYRVISPDAFFLMFWEYGYMSILRSVGPDLYAKFNYVGEDISISFYDDDNGRVCYEMKMQIFQDLFRQAYDEVRDWDLHQKALGDSKYGYNKLFRYPGSLDALFHYMNLKMWRRGQEDDVPVSFDFEFVEPYDCDTKYMIKIGDSHYTSFLSDYTTDFNDIRLSLEKIITTLVANDGLRLFFEDTNSIVRVEQFRSSWQMNKPDEKVIVKVMPDEFYEGPLLCGICKKREVLSSLYLGFLRLCITPSSSYNDDGNAVSSWDEFRLATYNKLQSCVIENYVLGIFEEECKSYPRQRWMSSVEEMEKDYAMLCERLKS